MFSINSLFKWVNDLHDDGVLVESIDASKTMAMATSFSKSDPWLNGESVSGKNLSNVKHRFLSSHLNAVTRKDQFLQMKAFEENILHKSSLTERNILSGVRTVEHLERKLQQVSLNPFLPIICFNKVSYCVTSIAGWGCFYIRWYI